MAVEAKPTVIPHLHAVLGERPWQPTAYRSVCFESPPISQERIRVQSRIRRKKRYLIVISIITVTIFSFVIGIIVGRLKNTCNDVEIVNNSTQPLSLSGQAEKEMEESLGIQVKATLSVDHTSIVCTSWSIMSVYDASTKWWYTPINAPPPTPAHNLFQCLQQCNAQTMCYRIVYDGHEKLCWMQWTNADDSWLCSAGSSVERVSVKKICGHDKGCPAYHKRCLCSIGPVINQTLITENSISIEFEQFSLHQLNTAVKCQGKNLFEYVRKRCLPA